MLWAQEAWAHSTPRLMLQSFIDCWARANNNPQAQNSTWSKKMQWINCEQKKKGFDFKRWQQLQQWCLFVHLPAAAVTARRGFGRREANLQLCMENYGPGLLGADRDGDGQKPRWIFTEFSRRPQTLSKAAPRLLTPTAFYPTWLTRSWLYKTL